MTSVENLELDVAIRSCKILELTPEKEWLAVSRKKLQFLLNQNASIPLHIISIIGDGHGGKSFLMNLLINYLKNNRTDLKGVMDKMSGFRYGYRKASTPVFNMVLVYPEVFINKTSDGKTYGILLLDTQGLFDGYDQPATLDQFRLCKSLSSTMLVNFADETYTKDTIESILTCLNGYNEISNHTNLLLLLRDEDDAEFSTPFPVYPFVLERFVKDLGSYEENYRLLTRRFNKILWFSLPRPSNGVISNKFEGIVENLPAKYLKAVKILFAKIIQPNYPCLLNGAEWSIIFQRMTLASKVQWTKFSREFIFATNMTFDSNCGTDSTSVNNQNSKENATDDGTQSADANTSVREKLSSVNEKKSTPKPLLAKEKELLEPLLQKKQPEEKTSGKTGKFVKPIKQNLKKEIAANKTASDKCAQSSDKSKIPSKTKPADKVKNINVTIGELLNTSKNEMIKQHMNIIFSESALERKRSECNRKFIFRLYLLNHRYQHVSSKKYSSFESEWKVLEPNSANLFPAILDQINEPNVDVYKVIMKMVSRAIPLAVEDYIKKILKLYSVEMSMSERSALHEKVTASILSSYFQFWDVPFWRQEFRDVLETTYYSLLSKFCQNKFDKQMESVSSVNDLYDADVNVLNDFFSSDMWLKPRNKVDKHVLSTILLNKLTEKAITLLTLDCQKILDEYVSGNLMLLVSTDFDETYEIVKNKAVSVMREINKLAVDDLVRELNQMKMKYNGRK